MRSVWVALAVVLVAVPSGAPVAQVTVELGPEETVVAWNDGQRCGIEDVPDQPARAFVDSTGRVHFLAGMGDVYQSVGDNLDALRHDCSAPIWSSHEDPAPRMYDDREGLWAPYTIDGQTVFALVHMEYHGWEHSNCNVTDAGNCWWNAVTLIQSRDAGASFQHVPLPPAHVVASSPYDFDPDNTTGPYGFFEPSNIVRSGNDYFAFVRAQPKLAQSWGVCLMRTSDLAAPGSWRGWDGAEFSIPMDRGSCPTFEGLGQMSSGLSFNAYLGRYLLIGNVDEFNFYFATSDSLTGWTDHQVLWATDIWWTPGAPDVRGYPSLLQPGDPSRNFERTGRSPYLYYTYVGPGAGNYERELRRRRVRFSVAGDEGRHELVDLAMNEHRGTATLDGSFYGNDGALEGGAVLDPQERATGPAAVRLPSSSSAVRVPDATSLDVVGSTSLLAFVRLGSPRASAAMIVAKDEGALRNYGLAVTSSSATTPGVVSFSYSGLDGRLSSSSGTRRVDDGHWHHVAVVYDGVALTARYYVDGELDVERHHDSALGAGQNDGDLLIGSGVSGAIDGVVIHDHVRSDEEIGRAAIPSGNIELCNGMDDDQNGVPDDGFDCVKGAVQSRACAGEPTVTQTRSCAVDCTLPEWPPCPDVAAPPHGGRCGCGHGSGASLLWILIAAAGAHRTVCARRRA